MTYVYISGATFAGLLMVAGLVMFFVREGNRVEQLLAMFAKGEVVRRGSVDYMVLDEDCGFVTLQAMDGSRRLRVLDLMTGAGTYRHDIMQTWSKARGPATTHAMP